MSGIPGDMTEEEAKKELLGAFRAQIASGDGATVVIPAATAALLLELLPEPEKEEEEDDKDK